jgi:hypothetical protein
VPSPPDTRGFLYCHVPDPAHPVATEVRFRLAQGGVDDPQVAFMLGRDLLLAPETPWRIHAMAIARSRSTYAPLATLLLRDDLVSQDSMRYWAEAKAAPWRGKRTVVLCRLDQSFVYRLHSTNFQLFAANKLDVRKVRLGYMRHDNRANKSPYAGMHCNPLRLAVTEASLCRPCPLSLRGWGNQWRHCCRSRAHLESFVPHHASGSLIRWRRAVADCW